MSHSGRCDVIAGVSGHWCPAIVSDDAQPGGACPDRGAGDDRGHNAVVTSVSKRLQTSSLDFSQGSDCLLPPSHGTAPLHMCCAVLRLLCAALGDVLRPTQYYNIPSVSLRNALWEQVRSRCVRVMGARMHRRAPSHLTPEEERYTVYCSFCVLHPGPGIRYLEPVVLAPN